MFQAPPHFFFRTTPLVSRASAMTRAQRQHDSGRRATIINRRDGARLRNETTRDDQAELWNGRTDGRTDTRHSLQPAANCRRPTTSALRQCSDGSIADQGPSYTQGDSDVISMPAGFRRHLVGKVLIYVFHRDITEIRFVDKQTRTFS